MLLFNIEKSLAKAYAKGPSGAVDYPDYLEATHVQWLTGGTTADAAAALTTSLEDVMETALGVGGNPYSSENAHDPSTELTANQTIFDTYNTAVAAIDYSDDFETVVTKAKSMANDATLGILLTDTEIDAAVTEFEDGAILTNYLRNMTQFHGSMVMINGVMSSAFAFGNAMIQSEYQNSVNRFKANLTLQQKTLRAQITQSFVESAKDFYLWYHSFKDNAARLQTEINRIKIVAEKEQTDRDLEIDVREAEWDFNVFKWGQQFLGSIHGGLPTTDKPSAAGSAIGGVLSGAATGASIGSAVPGLGTAAGAGIGAVLGGLAEIV